MKTVRLPYDLKNFRIFLLWGKRQVLTSLSYFPGVLMKHRTAPKELIRKLVYLDVAYIADMYEASTGESPRTIISRSEGKKAAASAYVFSADISAQETRSYSLSSVSMLQTLLESLDGEQLLNPDLFSPGMPSAYGWVEGELTVFEARSSVRSNETGQEKITAEDQLYQIRMKGGKGYALITTPEYFSSGLGTFVKLQKTVLKVMSIPVRAYVRVTAANSYDGQWISIPLVIIEHPLG